MNLLMPSHITQWCMNKSQHFSVVSDATPILWLELPDGVVDGGPLPLIYGLSPSEREAIDSLVHVETDSRGRQSYLCRDHLKNLSSY